MARSPLTRRLDIWRRRVVVGSFVPETVRSIDMTDDAIGVLETRISALEEIIAARWPRSMFLRRRLARDLRASSVMFAWAGSSFRARRAEAMTEELA